MLEQDILTGIILSPLSNEEASDKKGISDDFGCCCFFCSKLVDIVFISAEKHCPVISFVGLLEKQRMQKN